MARELTGQGPFFVSRRASSDPGPYRFKPVHAAVNVATKVATKVATHAALRALVLINGLR